MARMKYVFASDIDLNKNYLVKARFDNLAEHPEDPMVGQVYYNTTDKCFYFYKEVPPVEQGGESTFMWERFVNTTELIDKLENKLVAGEGVSITRITESGEDKLRISLNANNTIYVKNFTAQDWVEGELSIPKNTAAEGAEPNGHECGSTPVLTQVLKLDNNRYVSIKVGYSHDLQGNAKLYSSVPFAGYVQLSSPYQNPASVEQGLDAVLYGSVSE